jgi:hypothetical protein
MLSATKVIADDTFHVFMLIAAILFVIATVMSIAYKTWVMALLCAGLAFVAAAYVVVS